MLECPVVATRIGGFTDSVRAGETGVLVNPGSPDDLARGIIELLRDPEKARALGRAGRKLMIERFTLRRTVDDLARLYQRLLSEAQRQRKFYNPLVSLLRLLAGVPVFVYLTFRLLFLDMYLPLYLPGHVARIRAKPIRFYFFARYLAIRLYFFLRYLPFRILAKLSRAYVRLRRLSPEPSTLESVGPQTPLTEEVAESGSD